MLEINGKSVYNALAMGKLCFYNRESRIVKRIKIDDIKAEVLRFEDARSTLKNFIKKPFWR